MTDEAHEQSINSLNSGISMYRNGCLAGAISNYRTAVDLDPDNATAWIRLGNALLERQQLLGNLDVWKQALEANPDDDIIRYGLARLLFLLGFEDEAIAEWKNVAESGSVSRAQAAAKMLERYAPHDNGRSGGTV